MKRAKLLWIDLEMTGLDPKKDKILEAAAIATDMVVNVLMREAKKLDSDNRGNSLASLDDTGAPV